MSCHTPSDEWGHTRDLPLTVTPVQEAQSEKGHECSHSCPGSPTSHSCPMNRLYAAIDPDISQYESMDCSIVVFDIKKHIEQIDDPDVRAEMEQQLEGCPNCQDLVDMEAKLRDLVHNACSEKAPQSLRENLLRKFSRGDDCDDSEKTT